MQDSSRLLDAIQPGDSRVAMDRSRQRASNQIIGADMLFDMGDYHAALNLTDAVDFELPVAEAARLSNIRGDILSYLEPRLQGIGLTKEQRILFHTSIAICNREYLPAR